MAVITVATAQVGVSAKDLPSPSIFLAQIKPTNTETILFPGCLILMVVQIFNKMNNVDPVQLSL